MSMHGTHCLKVSFDVSLELQLRGLLIYFIFQSFCQVNASVGRWQNDLPLPLISSHCSFCFFSYLCWFYLLLEKNWFDVIWFVVRQLDIVIDNVASTVLILEAVQSSMNKMNDEELNAFHLDANLGGTSAVLQRKSVERCVSLTAFMTRFDNSTFWLEFCYFYVLNTVQPGLTRNVPSA